MTTINTFLVSPPKFLFLHSKSSSKSCRCTTTDAGLLFSEKIMYLSTDLQINTQRALTRNPILRTTSLSTFQSIVEAFSRLGFSKSETSRILDMHPILLTADPDRFFYPVIEFLLNEASIPLSEIPKSVSRCPRLLVSSVPNRLRPNLEYLASLGFTSPKSINAQTTLLLVYDRDATFGLKVEFLRGLGIEMSEVKTMVVRSPAILTYSVENNLKPKAEYLVDEIRKDLSELKRFPQYFSFSLERKIKSRHQVLVRNGIEMSIAEMLRPSDQKFSDLLVEKRLQRYGSHDKEIM